MSGPPFPVPAGMTWDGEKKRFFKKPPQEVKIRYECTRQSQGDRTTDQNDQNRQVLERTALAAPLIGSRSLLHSTVRVSSQSTYANSQAHKRALVKTAYSSLKHVATTSLIPWRLQGLVTHSSQCATSWRSNVKVTSLRQIPGKSSLLCFQDRAGINYLIETSHNYQQTSSALKLRYWTMSSPHLRNLGVGMNQHTFDAVRDESDISIGEATEIQRGAFDTDKDFAVFSEGTAIMLKNITADEYNDASIISAGKYTVDQVRIWTLPLSEEEASYRLLIVYSMQRKVALLEIDWERQNNTKITKVIVKSRRYCNTSSDIICIEIAFDGTSILAGLRSGEILQYEVADFLRSKKRSTEPQGGPIPSVDGDQNRRTSAIATTLMKYACGAVTHLKAISSHEMLVAFSDGIVELRSLHDWSKPIVSYLGHVNTWSLDLVSLQHSCLPG